MKRLLSVLCLISSLSLAADDAPPSVTFKMAVDRAAFGTEDAPLHLTFTFQNTGTQAFVLCPNRIEDQNTIKFIVVRNPSEFPTNAPKWESIPSVIADYYHGDEEQYVTVGPGESYDLKDDYFTNFKSLLRWGERGVYYVKAYFNGSKQSAFNAPDTVKARMLRCRLESNIIKLSVGVQQTK